MEISETTGQWLGWIGIIVGIIGFFWQPVWMGIIAIVLGIIGLFSDQKTLNWIAIIVGAAVLLYAFLF
ncbi:DUF308 domain-containing protein [Fundicoccus culcitae]|uniref:Protein Asterix n=1 Tax=Fundicoccus culcitae TaxID=2969821 RepID=A0ABY5P4L8_9LACT|nr:DUF308 domain-containing protein [Fundicoccus culcitae]UUX33699.1 protein Asterix [Fundicoccus culcitae]